MPMIERWSKFIETVRNFFREKNYIEVSTPILRRYPNLDPNTEPVEVKLKNSEGRFWLHTSPEYAMKKILSRYGKDIFQITKVFRNDAKGKLHSPEFTMLEWYKVSADYNYIINELKELLSLFGYNDFETITVEEAFERYADIILSEDEEIFKNNLITAGYEFDDKEDWETIFYRIYLEVERNLGKEKPTFLINFPKRLAILAKTSNNYAERFELYINGVEIANGWTEETDPEEVERRLKEEAEKRNLPLDKEFIEAHKNMPESAGCSVGLERLFMVKEGLSSIWDIDFLKL